MNVKEIKSQFTLGHVGTIAITLLVIGGLLTAQNWKSVQAMFDSKDKVAEQEQQGGSGLYYAYQAPVVPTVLGANSEPDGPGVINEDGTVTSLSSLEQVLGASSDSPEVNLEAINVNTIPGTQENLRNYIDESFLAESKVLPGDFETALVSKDEAQTKSQINILNQVQQTLSAMKVPDMAAKLHKIKIAQYSTAADLLKNFGQADSNPELVSSKLTQFMDMQKAQDAEMQKIFKQYPQL